MADAIPRAMREPFGGARINGRNRGQQAAGCEGMASGACSDGLRRVRLQWPHGVLFGAFPVLRLERLEVWL